ncbi:MAG: TIGR03936 family radical SAM-associated protein, partial [Coleofasciculaceae cyanobacterium]
EQGWDKIKLYFMIGLPGETDVDVLGIAETVRWLQQQCQGYRRRLLNFNLTISNFTPKPHTPFQWHSVSTSEFKRKQELLRSEFRRMRGVKANFTDVRISAMEDFVGRGDRRLSGVVRRAWQLGAGMDSWFENLDQAYGAWENAIAESDLTWKYRQVENGEWNIFGKENLAETEVSFESLNEPLPWDHIDTGIDKNWLINDLQKALEAATVPDCSFEGCSHCGICGTDFGHNIVIEAPPIPEFKGEFKPNPEKVQRLRVWFGKLGNMALVSHLDLVRLFERVIRRAVLPVAYTNGFHPSPRIMIANALPLGATSSGEIVDFELTQVMDVEVFQAQLAAKMPEDMPVYRVEAIDLKAAAATQILEKAEYWVTVAAAETTSIQQWQDLVEKVKGSEEILWEKVTKSGKKAQVNLRDRLFELEVKEVAEDNSIVLRYVGSCRNDGTLLRPEHLVYMLEQVAGMEFQLLHSHRQQLILESI